MRISIAIFITALTSASSFLLPTTARPRQLSFLPMAGFGSGGSSKKGNKKANKGGSKTKALRPKAQWDTFKNMKKSSRIRVASRVVGAEQWYGVGHIKSESDEFTELAVVLQRGLIADHAKRLHPLQFLPKDLMEWSYESNGDWVTVDKTIANSAPSGIAKMIGFQGNPDGSGFYSSTGGKKFVGESSTARLATGSSTLDNSVLPRVK